MAGGLMGMCLGEAGALLYGRAEPAPPRGGQAEGGMASRGKARGWRERRFSRRGAVSAPPW